MSTFILLLSVQWIERQATNDHLSMEFILSPLSPFSRFLSFILVPAKWILPCIAGINLSVWLFVH